MPIQDLLELIVTLRKRIDEHVETLRASEALTRYSLIDPMLRGLGWETDDPALVVPEYREPSINRKPDYVLLRDAAPFIVVEAKKLGENLQDNKIIEQGLRDCAFTKSSFFIITDGRLWDLYDQGRVEPKIKFDVKDASAAQVCLKAMALWRPSATSGKMTIAETPLVGLPPDECEPVKPPPPTPPNGNWRSLAEIKTEVGQKIAELEFPDNSTVETTNWRDVVTEIVRWMTDRGTLTAANCPIMSNSLRAKRYMVNTRPFHSDGTEFKAPRKVNGLYIELNHDLSHLCKIARRIVSDVHQDASQYRVRTF